MISRLRDYKRGALTLYAPVNDLSSLSKTEGKKISFSSTGPLFAESISGSEQAWVSSIVQNRGGITLRPGIHTLSSQSTHAEDCNRHDLETGSLAQGRG